MVIIEVLIPLRSIENYRRVQEDWDNSNNSLSLRVGGTTNRLGCFVRLQNVRLHLMFPWFYEEAALNIKIERETHKTGREF